jgi:hypothetical protein
MRRLSEHFSATGNCLPWTLSGHDRRKIASLVTRTVGGSCALTGSA